MGAGGPVALRLDRRRVNAWLSRRATLRGMRRGILALGLVAACLAVGYRTLVGAGDDHGDRYRVLQINLCNSGLAPCFTGDAVTGAIALIDERRPSVVTLNEACAPDLQRIEAETGYVSVFTQSGSRRCRNGALFGNGLAFPPGTAPDEPEVVEYTTQDADPERRTITCVPASGVTACVTHLSPVGPARAQASEMASVVARHAARGPTVVAGDWNLSAADAERYVPAGMFRTGDGSVQHVLATDGFRAGGTDTRRQGWTDHPVLQVDLRR